MESKAKDELNTQSPCLLVMMDLRIITSLQSNVKIIAVTKEQHVLHYILSPHHHDGTGELILLRTIICGVVEYQCGVTTPCGQKEWERFCCILRKFVVKNFKRIAIQPSSSSIVNVIEPVMNI